jgi:heat shock protein HtpX
MAHVRNRDILVMTIAATLAGAISIAARWALIGGLFGGGGNRNQNGWLLILVAVTAPIAALMVQLAVSRSREYGADRGGAEISGRPLYLAKALEKLEVGNRRRPLDYGSPASSSMFIVNPFRGGGFVSLFSTHPPVQERIKRLQKMADDLGQY